MNPDFAFKEDSRPVKDGRELFTRVLYKGEVIANIVHGFEASVKGLANGKTHETYEAPSPEEYVKTYGYLAEHRRQWNNGNKVNWDESLRVGEYARREKPTLCKCTRGWLVRPGDNWDLFLKAWHWAQQQA